MFTKRLNLSGLVPLMASAIIIVTGCTGNREARETDARRVTPLSTGPGPVERAVPREIVTFDEDAGPIDATKPTEEPASPAAEPGEPTDEPSAAVRQLPAPKAPPSKPTPTTHKTFYVNASSLNVRTAAGEDARVTDRLPRNAVVTVTDEAEDTNGGQWSRIAYLEDTRYQFGWVASSYLSTSKSSAQPSVETRSAPESRSATATRRPGGPRLTRTAFKKPEGDYFAQFERLNYTPVPKPSLPGNPKIDVKGVYVSFAVLKSDRFDEILRMLETTELNALVIDFKDDVGGLIQKSPTAAALVPEAQRKAEYENIQDLIRGLKARNIYLIARIVTFKDPMFARAHPEVAIIDRNTGKPYKSDDGLAWASPYATKFREYNIGLATEAAKAGFNEIQFDYVRFPDVPRTANLNYGDQTGAIKAEAIQSFLLEARQALKPYNVYTAADVFGWITTTVDDLRIGQYWEAMSNAVDFICPMMYPSHYAKGNYNLDNPNAQPYEVITAGLTDATLRDKALNPPAVIRPWLQGFDWGGIDYNRSRIQAQIRAAKEFGINGYLIWHPTGRYDAAAYR